MNSSIKICKVKWLLVCACVCVCVRARARARAMEVRLCSTISPRAQGVLFTFSRPKGLKVVTSVEISADFENPFLKKICVERFS